MRDKTIVAFKQLLNAASTSTDKVLRWNIRPDLDVVIQQDNSSEQGVIWLPWPLAPVECPPFGEVYRADRGRHSNSSAKAPSLAKGKAVLRLTVRNDTDLDAAVRIVRTAMGNWPSAPPSVNSAPAVEGEAMPERSTKASKPSRRTSGGPQSDTMTVTGVVIKSPWIDLILEGKKTWEIRGRSASPKQGVALIKSQSGMVIGTCRLVGCAGPLTLAEMHANADKHQIPLDRLRELPYPTTYAWLIADARRLEPPIQYQHPSGAVIWVRLDEDNVGEFERLRKAAS